MFLSIQRVSLIRESGLKPDGKVTSVDNARKVLCDYYAHMAFAQEVFVVMTLDTKHNITGVVEITRGILDATLIHPREVFAPAIIAKAAAIIVAHNHPSGNASPSREDIQVTVQLREAGKVLGITVLDHIVVGDHTGETTSLQALGV